jgi:thiol-disulfide isomerase/thioredoxin
MKAYCLFIILIVTFNFRMNAQSDSLPVLTGKFSSLIVESQWFKDWLSMSTTSNKTEVVERIKQRAQGVEVLIFLGTWCEDSRLHVPKMITILNETKIPFTLIGVNREKECPFEKKECKNWDILFVPTFVVMYEGKELGRIVESPVLSLEEDLAAVLERSSPSK